MKIENLTTGMAVKNYKELCSLLGVSPKTSGTSKMSQVENFKRYFSFSKQGQKIIIEEVYEMPKEKQDKRKDGNNTVPYIKYIETLILDLLVQSKGKGNGVVFLSKNKLFKEFKMTNNNYSECKKRMVKLSKFMNVDLQIIEEWYESTDGILKRNLEKALDNLRKQSLVIWSSEITVCKVDICELGTLVSKETKRDAYDEEIVSYNVKANHNLNHRESTEEEKQAILEAERNTMIDMGYDNKQEIVAGGEWDKFKNRVNDILLKNYQISFYYSSYKIVFNMNHIQDQYDRIIDSLLLGKQERESNQNQLNEAIVERLKDTSQKKQDRALNDMEYILGFSKDEKIRMRVKDAYTESTNNLINTLIDKGSKNIASKVKKIKLSN